jgi:hypothetical protein
VLESKAIDAEERSADPRWQLVERISATEPFRKSPRFRDLLHYLAERALDGGNADELTERAIGQAVFGKPADYSPTEDSTVRVHVRQLRLKLHEYFDTAGRQERIILEVPKGGFMPVFQEVPRPEQTTPPTADRPNLERVTTTETRRQPWLVPFLVSAVLFLGATCAVLLYKLESTTTEKTPPWPVSMLVSPEAPTTIVTADANFTLQNMLLDRYRTLSEYLDPSHSDIPNLKTSNAGERNLVDYISGSSLTSSADAVISAKLASRVGAFHGQVSVRSARDLHPRDFESGNFIIVGSATSNPWASMFQNQQNFEEDNGLRHNVWKNKSPKPGEQSTYECLSSTGSTGTGYADIALLPGKAPHTAVLLLQGCVQESTESTATYLFDPGGQSDLLKALGFSNPPTAPFYFEALIKTQAIAGAPVKTSVVAARLIQPKS